MRIDGSLAPPKEASWNAGTTPAVRPVRIAPEAVPFRSRRIEIDGRTISYSDQGEGPPLLFVQAGTGALLWREVIVRLRERFRCVAPDVFGARPSVTAEGADARSRVLEAFVRRLDLSEVTLVLHGLGGPVALGTAPRLRDRIRALVATESIGWPLSEEPAGSSRLVGLAADVTLGPRDPALSDDFLRGVDRTLRTVLRDRPVLLVFGEGSPAVRAGAPERWRERFPDAGLLLVDGAHRFPMTDAPDIVARAITGWWQEEVLAA